MLADMLDAPVAELSVGDNVDIGKNFLDAWSLKVQLVLLNSSIRSRRTTYLVLFEAILKDVLDHKAPGLS